MASDDPIHTAFYQILAGPLSLVSLWLETMEKKKGE